jgi:hypothetical protein
MIGHSQSWQALELLNCCSQFHSGGLIIELTISGSEVCGKVSVHAAPDMKLPSEEIKSL